MNGRDRGEPFFYVNIEKDVAWLVDFPVDALQSERLHSSAV